MIPPNTVRGPDKDRLKAWRKSANLSQQELAEKCGLDLRTIQNLEQGRDYCYKSTLRTIADALGVVPSALQRKTYPHELLSETEPKMRATVSSPLTFLPKAPFRISPATLDDLRWIAATEQEIYNGVDVIPFERMQEWYDSNPDGFSIIKDRDGHRCGNIDVLPIRQDTLNSFLNGELIEQDIRGLDIHPPEELDEITSLYVESIVCLSETHVGNPLAVYKSVVSSPDLLDRVSDISRLSNIYAIGGSSEGIRLMQDLGFDHIDYGSGPRKDGHRVFVVTCRDFVQNVLMRSEGDSRKHIQSILDRIDEG